MNLLLSIIVPVYNVEKYLERCLDSILVQPFRNFELILVNDGSTDNSLSICKRYEATNNRIVIVDKPNGGLSSARNAGLKVAKGNYVSFIDSDDFISSDFYEANMEFLEQNPDIDMMILPYCKYSDTDNVLYKMIHKLCLIKLMYLIICFRTSIIVRYGDVFTKLIYSYIQGLPKGDCLKTDISYLKSHNVFRHWSFQRWDAIIM